VITVDADLAAGFTAGAAAFFTGAAEGFLTILAATFLAGTFLTTAGVWAALTVDFFMTFLVTW
jgi:hypothetical protein